ncbi:hypothetical protein CVT26_004463 [Gymnopilus dilepis]|uniref:Transmembrane protein n=1 Tax=Gymnopilus dilepis TaxID=231916 RepID=A0A409WE41_9AGAR|nr:hypothetical protein CVT26_004463 [Gymnopilus dilepis]
MEMEQPVLSPPRPSTGQGGLFDFPRLLSFPNFDCSRLKDKITPFVLFLSLFVVCIVFDVIPVTNSHCMDSKIWTIDVSAFIPSLDLDLLSIILSFTSCLTNIVNATM